MSASRMPRTGGATAWWLMALAMGVLVGLPGEALAAPDRRAEQVLEAEPPELVERLLEEGVLILEDAGDQSDSFVVAYVVFDRSLEDVLSMIRQASRQTEYRPELSSVETIRRFEGGRIDEQRIRIMFTTFVYRVRYRDLADSEGRVEWQLDPEYQNDLSRFEGFWEFFPYASDPNRTLARFGSKVDVGPIVPQFIQTRMGRKTVVRYVQNCRQWINSNGEWRP